LQPQDADTLYRQAQSSCQAGRLEEGIELIRRALVIAPASAPAHVLLGQALAGLGKVQDALAAIERAIQIDPALAAAHGNHGDLLATLGRHQDAVASYDRAIAIEPDAVANWLNRGAVLFELGRYDEALIDFDRVAELAPDFAQAHFNRANTLLRQGRDPEALAAFDRGLALDPTNVEGLYGRGSILARLDRPTEAAASFERLLAVEPANVEALANHGAVLFKLERFDEALSSFRQASELRPDDVDLLYRLGFTLGAVHRHAEALAAYERLLQTKPDHVDALLNHGIELQQLHRDREALASYAKITAIEPDHVDAHLNEALALLTLGDFRSGLSKFEWRLKKHRSWERDVARAWRGRAPIDGRTILLYPEQGLGDSIQMVRYVPVLARQGARVVLEVPPPLKALMSRVEGAARVVASGEPVSSFDYHCPLMSLPLAMGTEPDTIPAHVPYLTAAPDDVATWATRLPSVSDGRLRVGINWCGNPAFRDDRNRSMTLDGIMPLLDVPGIDFVTLNPGIHPQDARRLSAIPHVSHVAAGFRDFSDTAAVAASLDLVVTTDTAIAHLAGAMARSLWIMLAAAPDWRYALDAGRNRWYPTARLFRQIVPGDWSPVVESVRRELAALAARARR